MKYTGTLCQNAARGQPVKINRIIKQDFIIDETMCNLIYINDKGLTTHTCITNLQFEVAHCIIACTYNLKIWLIKPTDDCNFCKQTDTIEHCLVESLWPS